MYTYVYVCRRSALARNRPPLDLGGFVHRVPAERARNPLEKIWGVSCAFRVPAPVLFQYCFNTVSMLSLTISDYLQPAAYRLQAAACRLQPAGCKLQPAACSLQATPWALKGPEYAKTYHFLMILATPTPYVANPTP